MYITGRTPVTECHKETIPWPKCVSTLSSVCLTLNPGAIKLFCPSSAVASRQQKDKRYWKGMKEGKIKSLQTDRGLSSRNISASNVAKDSSNKKRSGKGSTFIKARSKESR